MLRRHRAHLVGSAVIASVAFVAVAAPARDTTERRLQPSLTAVVETRRLDVIPQEDPSPFDRAGLDLMFELPLPDGVQLLDMEQPNDTPKAVDSTGRDLARIKPGFGGEREYVEVDHHWNDEDPWTFKVHLALPARGAETIDLSLTAMAVTFTDVDSVDVELDDQWREIAARAFGRKVEARLQSNNNGLSVAVRPGTVRDAIEEVVLEVDGTELESGWSMWSDDEISFSFSGSAAKRGRATFKVRTGLGEYPVALELKGQQLP